MFQTSLFDIDNQISLEGINDLLGLVDKISGSNCCGCVRSTFRQDNPKTNITVYRGNTRAEVWVVGKSPGVKDSIKGIPYSHGSGEVLIKMLKYIGLDESNTFMTNPVFCPSEGDSTPTVKEMTACSTYFNKMIEVGKPKLFIALGGTAFRALTDETRQVSEIAGKDKPFDSKFIDDDGNKIPIWVLYHPAVLFKEKADVDSIKRSMLVTLNSLKLFLEKKNKEVELTVGEAAKALDVSAPRISQLDANILRKMRWTARVDKIEEVVNGKNNRSNS